MSDLNNILLEASWVGDTDLVKSLIFRGADVNFKNPRTGQTPAYRAAAKGNLDCLKVLVENGANLQILDNLGMSALHIAAATADAKTVRFLISMGLSTEQKNANEQTPLVTAAMAGQIANMQTLLDIGNANINMVDEDGWSVLHHAAYTGQTRAVLYLLERGARRDKTPIEGWTPEEAAKAAGHEHTAKEIMKFYSTKNNLRIQKLYRNIKRRQHQRPQPKPL